MQRVKKPDGFSLIELMITVAIVAILATIALPAYDQYIIRANRRAAQADMMAMANREQQYFLANRGYATTLPDLSFQLEDRVSQYYQAPVITTPTVASFTITLTPRAGTKQANDGALVLTSDGVKTRDGDAAKW